MAWGRGCPFTRSGMALWWWHLSRDLNRVRSEWYSCQGVFSWQRSSRYKGPEASGICKEKQGASEGRGWTGAGVGELGRALRRSWRVLQAIIRPLAFPLSEMASNGPVTRSDSRFNRMASFSSFLCSFCEAHHFLPLSPFGWVTIPEPVNFLSNARDVVIM